MRMILEIKRECLFMVQIKFIYNCFIYKLLNAVMGYFVLLKILNFLALINTNVFIWKALLKVELNF